MRMVLHVPSKSDPANNIRNPPIEQKLYHISTRKMVASPTDSEIYRTLNEMPNACKGFFGH